MSIRRTLALSAITALSTAVIGFVAADRLASGPVAPTLPSVAAARAPEPETTGALAQTVTQQGAVPEAGVPRLVNGFDTERLNALMRGDPAPSRRR